MFVLVEKYSALNIANRNRLNEELLKKDPLTAEIFDTFIIKPKIMRVCLYIVERSMIAKRNQNQQCRYNEKLRND